jgi:hypothetical protein
VNVVKFVFSNSVLEIIIQKNSMKFEHELYGSSLTHCCQPLCQLGGTEARYPGQHVQSFPDHGRSEELCLLLHTHFFAPDCNVHVDALQFKFGKRRHEN